MGNGNRPKSDAKGEWVMIFVVDADIQKVAVNGHEYEAQNGLIDVTDESDAELLLQLRYEIGHPSSERVETLPKTTRKR